MVFMVGQWNLRFSAFMRALRVLAIGCCHCQCSSVSASVKTKLAAECIHSIQYRWLNGIGTAIMSFVYVFIHNFPPRQYPFQWLFICIIWALDSLVRPISNHFPRLEAIQSLNCICRWCFPFRLHANFVFTFTWWWWGRRHDTKREAFQ